MSKSPDIMSLWEAKVLMAFLSNMHPSSVRRKFKDLREWQGPKVLILVKTTYFFKKLLNYLCINFLTELR